MKNDTGKDLVYALLSLNPLFRKLIDRPMELEFSDDLTVTQFHTMVELSFTDAMNMTQLAAQLYISKQQLTKIIDGLVEKGFVRRFGDENNRRVVLVEATEKGRKLMLDTQTQFVDSFAPAFDRLSDVQKRKVAQAVEDIRQTLSNVEPRMDIVQSLFTIYLLIFPFVYCMLYLTVNNFLLLRNGGIHHVWREQRRKINQNGRKKEMGQAA